MLTCEPRSNGCHLTWGIINHLATAWPMAKRQGFHTKHGKLETLSRRPSPARLLHRELVHNRPKPNST